MNDLEDRLRTTLDELAGTVPPGPHARADLERRLTGRNRRRPLLVAAAAVVVVAGVAVPIMLNLQEDQVATTPVMTTTSPPRGDRWITLGQFTENGVEKRAELSVSGDGKGWCIAERAADADRVTLSCETLPVWSTTESPGGNVYVITRAVLSDGKTPYSGPLPNLLLFVTSPMVATLEVDGGDGLPVPVRQLARLAGGNTMYLAEFPQTYAGVGWTAKDAAGNVLVSAIT